MRDRLKRPKKNAEAGKSEPAQAPLQPAYYDAAEARLRPGGFADESSEPKPPNRKLKRSRLPELRAGREESCGSACRPGPAPGWKTVDPRRRRRRGRGGRGRGGARSSPGRRQPAVAVLRTRARRRTASPALAPRSKHQARRKQRRHGGPRASKGTVVLAIGLPGSGKSSWFKRHNITPLSSDMLRALLFDDPTEQRFQDLIFSNLRSMLKARLIARRPLNYVDATNLTPHERQSWIKLGAGLWLRSASRVLRRSPGGLPGAQSQAGAGSGRRRNAAHERQAEGADVRRRFFQDYRRESEAEGIMALEVARVMRCDLLRSPPILTAKACAHRIKSSGSFRILAVSCPLVQR